MALKRTELAGKFPFLSEYTAPVKKMERPLIGRDEELSILRAALMRPELCNVILLGEAGSGKALEDSTLIPVADKRGYVPIGSLKPGDKVFDEAGRPVKVLRVFPQGELDAFLVRFSDGSEVICNDEHIWQARTFRDAANGKPFRSVTLREMMERGVRCGSQKSYWWRVPVNQAVRRPEQEYPIDPYVLGVLIANGCLTDSLLTVSTAKGDMVERAARAIGAVASRNPHNYSWRFRRTLEDGVSFKYVRTDELSELLSAAGIEDTVFGRKTGERRIPAAYLLGSEEQRQSLLQGMMDANGVVFYDGRGSCYLTVASESLAREDVVPLLNSLGYRAKLLVRNGKNRASPEYKIRVMGAPDAKRALFQNKTMLARVDELSGIMSRRHVTEMQVVDMRPLGRRTKMTCIYVDGESHLFQCGREHLVTHNTALVQGMMAKDAQRDYMEVDLARMIANVADKNELAAKLKMLFDEISGYREASKAEVVLFIDEFHQIVQLSDAAVEALKPLLADSGTRGVRVIAATTYEEFRKWVAPNLPLVERLQRINLVQPNKETVVEILKNMARRYDVEYQFTGDYMFEQIYEYTNRYMPAASQPRKSILLLDAMIGWHRSEGRRLDHQLLADVIRKQEGINVAFRVDATRIRDELNRNVLSQQFATNVISQRLQICVADLNDKSKPMSSFLFTGSTGVGKSCTVTTPVPMLDENKCIVRRPAGEVTPGDWLFDRYGGPTRVLGVFPQGPLDVYRVTLEDGRSLDVSGNHLWGVIEAGGNDEVVVRTTEEMLAAGVSIQWQGKTLCRYAVPVNGPVRGQDREYSLSPYTVGLMLGYNVSRVRFGRMHGEQPWFDEAYGQNGEELRIPEAYRTGSVEQRWQLVRGLFDAAGHVASTADGEFCLRFVHCSGSLVKDVREVLFSLGFSTGMTDESKVLKGEPWTEYRLKVFCGAGDVTRFFLTDCKWNAAEAASENMCRDTDRLEMVGIRSIEALGVKEDMVCFYVDNAEHLYQAGEYIVTHNTEMAKQLARILFEDDRNLIRMDMTEFANPDSLDRFRSELTNKVWTRPYSIILMDEIEKACGEVTRILLQVLDDGRLIDDHNREVTFTNAYIILTTNAGSEIYKNIAQYAVDDTGSGERMKEYNKLIRQSITSTQGANKFPPELLGRIDSIVPFQPLSEETMKNIVKKKLLKLKDVVLAKHNVQMRIVPDVVKYLVEDRLDQEADSGGARAVMSKLESEVTMKVAEFINTYPDARSIAVTVEGTMASEDLFKLNSEAYVRVTALRQAAK